MTAARGGRTILVVEDDATTRDALLMFLGAEGFNVVGAANGQEALGILRGQSRPDLILLDLMMPIMDGWQFRREQDRDPGLSAIPVVVLSADSNLPQKAASLRVADYLQKPVDVDKLLTIIQRYS